MTHCVLVFQARTTAAANTCQSILVQVETVHKLLSKLLQVKWRWVMEAVRGGCELGSGGWLAAPSEWLGEGL